MYIIRRRIFKLFTVTWMCIIFIFSSQDAGESTKTSNLAGDFLGKIFCENYDELSDNERLELIEAIEYPVRKAAHFAEFALLGFFIFGSILDEEKSKMLKCVFISWLVGTLYAASDEIHQLFVPGRSGMFTDVLIDSGGVLVGILLMCAFIIFCNKIKQRLRIHDGQKLGKKSKLK